MDGKKVILVPSWGLTVSLAHCDYCLFERENGSRARWVDE